MTKSYTTNVIQIKTAMPFLQVSLNSPIRRSFHFCDSDKIEENKSASGEEGSGIPSTNLKIHIYINSIKCIKLNRIFWDNVSVNRATREILGIPFQQGQYKLGQVNNWTSGFIELLILDFEI